MVMAYYVHLRGILFLWMAAAACAQQAIDFSYAGYGGGGAAIPLTPAVISVRPSGGDDTRLLQDVLDRVGRIDADGRTVIGAQYCCSRDGTAWRGGCRCGRAAWCCGGAAARPIVATGKGRRTLIEIGGESDAALGAPVRVADEYVPAGGRTLHSGIGWRTEGGRPGGDHAPEHGGMDRRAEDARPAGQLRQSAAGLDSGLAQSGVGPDGDRGGRGAQSDHGGRADHDGTGTAVRRRDGGAGDVASLPMALVGIENLTLESEFDAANPRDEEHSWIAVALDRVEDAWVRKVVARHFAGSAVRVGPRARRVTIEALPERAAGFGAGRLPAGRVFWWKASRYWCGNARASSGMNDFARGLLAAGPNVFLDSTASGAHWARADRLKAGRRACCTSACGSKERATADERQFAGAGRGLDGGEFRDLELRRAKEIEARGPEGAENVVKRSAEPLYESQLARRTGAKLLPAGGTRSAKTRRAFRSSGSTGARLRRLRLAHRRWRS